MRYAQPCSNCLGQQRTASHDAERYAREADIARVRADNVQVTAEDPTAENDRRHYVALAKSAEQKATRALARLIRAEAGNCWLCDGRGVMVAPGTFITGARGGGGQE